MSDATAAELIHWISKLVEATNDATASAERRHEELMKQRDEHFRQDQYSRGLIASYGAHP